MNAGQKTRLKPLLRTLSCGLLVLGALFLAGCGGAAGPAIEAHDVWARPAMGGGMQSEAGSGMAGMAAAGTGAVFMRLTNDGGEADRLKGGRTDVAQVVEIHETVMEGDVMHMQMLADGLEIPARGEVMLQPGGYHVMLIGMQRDLAVGDEFTLELDFEKSGTLAVQVQVKQP
ncbi:MAG: copper chaperone PCu(A)C [Anaerolineae bacterium]